MKLTEGQLFTIEALNRIEGFVWPKCAEFASVGSTGEQRFYETHPVPVYLRAQISQRDNDLLKSVVSKEQFDSVNGWVRNDGHAPVINDGIDLMLANDEMIHFSDISADRWNWSVLCNGGVAITHWRCHKTTKEKEMQQQESNSLGRAVSRDGIEELISKHKAAKEIARLARIELERVEEAEHSLMLSIEAWAESHGFDIRVLSESEEKPEYEPEPELVVTNWRDLRVGDEVMIGPYLTSKGEIISVDHENATAELINGFPPVKISDTSVVVWKFLCRK